LNKKGCNVEEDAGDIINILTILHRNTHLLRATYSMYLETQTS